MKERIDKILQEGRRRDAAEADRKKMLALFHETDAEYELKSNLFGQLNDQEVPEDSHFDVNSVFEKLWKRIERNRKHQVRDYRIVRSFVRVAAAVVIGVFAGYFINSMLEDTTPVYYTAQAPRGSVSEVLMPDGSLILLNSDSQIKYSADGEKGNREVFLNGEAWFEVEKNKKKPFVVHTPYYDVNVTGTKFNVKAYDSDNDIATTLTEGRVVIKSSKNFRLSKSVILKPGQQMALNKKTRKVSVKKVNTKWYTSWKDNKLIFVNMSLKDFTVILERKYGVDIEISDKSIIDLHIDCTIKDESILEILDIIQKTLPVKYRITGQKIEITKK